MKNYNTDQRTLIKNNIKQKVHQSFTAKELHEELKDSNVSLSAIYRNLADFEKDGTICRVFEKERSETLYQYLDSCTCEGVLHLKCETCNNTYHLNAHITQMIEGLSKDLNNFNLNKSMLFLYGKCSDCLNKEEQAK